MGMLDNGGMEACVPPMTFDVKPRVFVRTPGEDYAEIDGVQSFERHDDEQGGARISFIVAGNQGDAVKGILDKKSDKYVDVKMEFMIGMLMVMSFSGFVEEFSEDRITFAVSTPVATDVLDVAQ